MKNGKRISIPDVTEMIVQVPAFKEVKKQIIDGEIEIGKIKVKMDKRLFS